MPESRDNGRMGATLRPDGVAFRVWAPGKQSVDVVLTGEQRIVPMQPVGDGTWSVFVPGLGEGTRYRYRLDGGDAFPDPYSRFQPAGVHGDSAVVAHEGFEWHDHGWSGLTPQGLTIYETHVGTATPVGTFDGLIEDLDRIRDLGVSAIEVMPVAEFSGRRNWGYDGVYLFAVSAAYGGPDAFKRFVDAAHQRGLGVILDVVYNHFGPEGNYLAQFAEDYFTPKHQTPWGAAVNYDGPNSQWVRQLVLDNAHQWIHEFHVDGLRLDAVFMIHDDSPTHILQELTQSVRRSLPPKRSVVLIAETSENQVRDLLPVEQGGMGFDAVWADDFHHGLRRYLAGDDEGYFRDYDGTLEELARTINRGFFYEGQISSFSGVPRGSPARDRPAYQFVYCIQNHDQVGNRAMGDRLHHQIDLARFRAASALLLLLPYTPLIFMGQELVASSPFQYFTDHSPELGKLVTAGRREEFRHYRAFSDPEAATNIPDTQAESTFLRSKLPLDEASTPPGAQVQALYRALLRLRRTDPALRSQDRRFMLARAAGPDLLLVAYDVPDAPRRLVVNFGEATSLPLSELGSVGQRWNVELDTNEPRFGGSGHCATPGGAELRIGARSAVFLAPTA